MSWADAIYELTPMQRYEQATAEGGWLTSAGWDQLAADLDRAASTTWGGSTVLDHITKIRDRAADCRARAATMRARGAAQPGGGL